MNPRRHRWPVLAAALLLLALAPLDANAAVAGQTCGGVAGVRCDAGLWCEPPGGQCGPRDVQGTCIRLSTVCTAMYLPVCGCDGKTYGNDCERQSARVQKRSDGACR